ncbi:MAG: ComEC/Rec2 family competence protein [Oscillospiraceae bacterium]|nr:ComEC/Rec2 family competence protein [Oscillospiraceae bacterium]
MKRKIVYVASAWATGLLFASFLPQNYELIIIPTAIILVLLMKFLFKFRLREIITVITIFVMAVGLYRIYDNFVYRKIISYNTKEISVDGKITDISEYTGDKCRYTVKGEINEKQTATVTVYADLYDCSINDRLKFTGIAEIYENDYLFNSLDYNKSKGIFLTCYEVSSLEIIPDDSFSVTRLLYTYKQTVTEFVKRNLPDTQASMVCGMLFGDKSGMDEDDKTLFYRMGIGHIMAVSGLHLVLFCGIFSILFDKMKFGRIKKFVFLEIIMTVFAVTSGLSVSILRASLMMTLMNLAPLFSRKADTLNSIGIAFVILTAINPFAITNPSLALSITSTCATGAFAPFLTKNLKEDTYIKKQLKQFIYMFLLSLAIMPFSVMFFGEISLVSPIANIFLTPLCMLALLIALISSLTVFLNPVFLIKLSGVLCELVMFVVKQVGKLKFTGINFTDEMKYISAGVILICLTVFLIFRTQKSLAVSVAASLGIFVISAVSGRIMMADKLNIALLGDKGVDVIVLSCDEKAEIIDLSGRKKNVRYALKFLQQNNINSIESVIIKSKAYQAMSSYNSGLSLIDVKSVIMPEDTFVRNDMTVCGEKPDFTAFSEFSADLNDVDVQINNTRICIQYGEFELVCDNSCNDNKTIVYAEYGNVFDPPKANAVIVPEYENVYGFDNLVTDRNVHIIAEKDGSFLIGGL